MKIQTKRIYENHVAEDGFRVLVDRLWPRGMKKQDAEIDEWARDIAPSDGLRREFHDLGPDSFGEFHDHFRGELAENRDQLRALLDRAHASGADTMTLLYSFRDTEHNNAVVIAEVLREMDA